MKKIITLIIIMLCSSVFSQSEINGIGRFKIGMDLSIIDSLKNENYAYKIFDKSKDKYNINSEDFIINKLNRKNNVKKQNADKVIFEKQISTDISDYGDFPFIENKKVFLIKYYNIADIDIDYLELYFYNNKLYEIKFSDNIDLKLALDTKYKSVKSEELGKKISCANAYREVEYQDVNYKDTFRNDENIYAYSSLNKFYYNCKEHIVSYTIICNMNISDEIFKLEKLVFMNKYNDTNKEEIKALKKL